MSEKQNQIRTLLTELVLVKPELKRKLLAQLEGLSETKTDVLLSYLQEAKANQTTLFYAASEENPGFLSGVKQAGSKLKTQETQAREQSEHAEDEKEISHLEEELETIFDSEK